MPPVLVIPPGFAQVLVPLQHSSQPRKAAVTFGIDISGASLSHQGICDAITAGYDSIIGAETDNAVTIGPTEISVGQDGGENLAVVGTITATGALNSSSMPSSVAGSYVPAVGAAGCQRG